MAAKKRIDRRVQRTRSLIQGALLELMAERGYEGLTVQHIIDRANVGRATFYAHFADKQTLLASGLEDLRSALLERQRAAIAARRGHADFTFSLAMLEHAADAVPLWRAIAGRESGAFVMQRLHDMLAELVRNDLLAMGVRRSAQQRELLVQQITGGFVAAMTWWLNDGARQTANEVDALFRVQANRGLKGARESR